MICSLFHFGSSKQSPNRINLKRPSYDIGSRAVKNRYYCKIDENINYSHNSVGGQIKCVLKIRINVRAYRMPFRKERILNFRTFFIIGILIGEWRIAIYRVQHKCAYRRYGVCICSSPRQTQSILHIKLSD